MPPRTVHLLVDTGAATSGIGHDIALSLGLIADEVISVVSVLRYFGPDGRFELTLRGDAGG